MLEKKFAQSLLFLVILLVFSAAGVMGANILFVSLMDEEHMSGDDAIKAFFEGPGDTVTYIDGDETEGSWQYNIALENGNCISVAEVHLFLLDSGLRASVQELTSCSKLVCLEDYAVVDCVVKRALPCIVKVYNFKVKKSERYLVGKDGIVVRDW